MPIDYAHDVKEQRMTVVAQALDGGSLQLLGAVGELLVEYKFQRPCGGVFGGLLHMNGAPFIAPAIAVGELSRATLLRADGTIVARNLEVGASVDADIRVTSTKVRPGYLVQLENIDIRHV